MIVDQVHNSIELGLFHARNVALLRSNDPKALIDASLSQDFGTRIDGTFVERTATDLAFYFGGDDNRKIVYVDGIANSEHAARVMIGYSDSPRSVVEASTNSYFFFQAARIFSRIGQFRVTPQYLDFVGHSAGGSTALAMAEQLRNSPTTPPRYKVITFGNPRAFGERNRDALSRSPITRWMTPGDPIPLIPLTPTDAPQIVPVIPVPIMMAWGLYCHTQGGIQVNGDGSTEARILPANAQASPVASVVDWLFQVENDPLNQHHINTYVNYLRAGQVTHPRPADDDVPWGGGEVANSPRRQEVQQTRVRVEGAIHRQGQAQNSIPVRVPPALGFKAIRQGRIWVVTFGDRVVLQAPIEDRARHIARAGNDFLRSLPKQALVDVDALAHQLETFLDLAVTPGSGVEPTVKTTLNQ